MRISKLSDSPLNESQFSDVQQNPKILDTNFQVSHKPNCYYHPDQIITNFCRSTNCLLPLCPECVKVHAASHRSHGTHGEFDTIDNTVNECYQEITKNDLNFREDEVIFKDFLRMTSEYPALMHQKLMQSKAKLQEIIETYYNKLSIDLDKRVSLQVQRFQSEIQSSLSKMHQRQEQIKDFMANLRSQRVLKTSIHLLSSTFCAEQLALHKELQSIYNLLNSQKIDVLSDDNILHNINCNLVKYVNVHNSDLYKFDETRSPMTQKIITTVPQSMKTVSPTKNIMINTMKPTILPQNSQVTILPQNSQIILQNPQTLKNSQNLQNVKKSTNFQNSQVLQNIPVQNMVNTQQMSYQISPQNRPPIEAQQSRFLDSQNQKIHKVHPSIPGNPVMIELKSERSAKENPVNVGNYLNVRPNNANIPVYISQSPPVRVRSVSPPQQMVRVAYNGGSNGKMNSVYMENKI